jgi:aerobic-type carbon monoxide dehydrogenase small subunit (CoxS/CutS family)
MTAPAPASAPSHPKGLGTLRVNGTGYDVPLAPDRNLLYVLREELGLTGTKYGCGEGECGACKVLLDGVAVRACQTSVGEVVGHAITTIEGLAQGEEFHPVQTAFVEAGAFQCGFCTPGMILQAVSLLRQNPDPSEDEIRAALNGNICRCGGYFRIVAAVQRASTLLRSAAEAPP